MLQMPRFLSTRSGRVRLLPQRSLSLHTRATPGRLRHTAVRLAAALRRDPVPGA